MDAAASRSDEPAGAPSAAPPPPRPEPLLQSLKALWRDLPGLLSDRIDLLSLELHRAGLAVVRVLVYGVAIAILGMTAWLLLWTVIVAVLVNLGLPPVVALVVAIALNLGAAAYAVVRIRRLLPVIRLPATRRHLMSFGSPTAAAPAASTPPAHDRPEPNAPGRPAVS